MSNNGAPVKTPTRVEPSIAPRVEPMRRYNPREAECPAQWQRVVRRIRP